MFYVTSFIDLIHWRGSPKDRAVTIDQLLHRPYTAVSPSRFDGYYSPHFLVGLIRLFLLLVIGAIPLARWGGSPSLCTHSYTVY